jgi:hypothetical protein
MTQEQRYEQRADPVLIDTFVLLRALRGPTHTEELGRMLAAINVDWDERAVRTQVEELERLRLLEREGTQLRLNDAGRREAQRVLELLDGILDASGLLHEGPRQPPGTTLAPHGGMT